MGEYCIIAIDRQYVDGIDDIWTKRETTDNVRLIKVHENIRTQLCRFRICNVALFHSYLLITLKLSDKNKI